MQLRRFLFLFLLSGFIAATLPAQNINRYIRISRHGINEIVRHPLGSVSNPGENFQFRYEVEPGKSMLRRINKSFPEFRQIATGSDELQVTRNTVLLEELDREAEEALNNLFRSTAGNLPVLLTDDIPLIARDSYGNGSSTIPVATETVMQATTSIQIGSEALSILEQSIATPAGKLP